MARLVMWLLVTIAIVGITVVLVPRAIFGVMPLDQSVSSRIGTLFGASADRVDIELALNPDLALRAGSQQEAGLLAIVPSNIFAALSSNDSLRVIVFAVIFGTGMVMSERRSGTSIFNALKHVQAVCIMIFDWFNLLVPIGIVALVAPQIAHLGRGVYAVLAPFVLALCRVKRPAPLAGYSGDFASPAPCSGVCLCEDSQSIGARDRNAQRADLRARRAGLAERRAARLG